MDYLSSDKIAIIDLSSGEVAEEYIDDDLIKENIGGAGVTSALYEQYRDDDPLILGAGLLTGTLTPGSSLGVMTARSPLTGRVCHAPLFLNLGMEIKYSGFDYLVIKGRAAKPVYLWIHDGIADLNPAGDLWGRDVWSAVDAVRKNMGDDLIQVLGIGPAGENGSPLAQVCQNHWGSGDRFGFGAVLGQKNLKLVALRGMGLLELAEPEEFVERCLDLLDEVKDGDWFGRHGLAAIGEALGEAGLADWLGPITHRHRASFNTPYAANTFVYFGGHPQDWKEPAEDEPGFLLTDPQAVISLKKLGLSAREAARTLMAAAKFGIDPAAVAEQAQKSGAADYEAITGLFKGMTGPVEKANFGPFSPFIPSSPIMADFGAADRAWWTRRQAVAHIFGLDPLFSLMSPELSEDVLVELANLGAELDLTPQTLDRVIERIAG